MKFKQIFEQGNGAFSDEQYADSPEGALAMLQKNSTYDHKDLSSAHVETPGPGHYVFNTKNGRKISAYVGPHELANDFEEHNQ